MPRWTKAVRRFPPITLDREQVRGLWKSSETNSKEGLPNVPTQTGVPLEEHVSTKH